MSIRKTIYGVVMLPLACVITQANAVEFKAGDDVNVSWNSQIIVGLGLRTKSSSCSLVGGTAGETGCGGADNTAQWGNGSLGNLNYKQGRPFSEFLKGTTELLVSTTDGYKFMIRDSLIYDQGATNTRIPLSSDAKKTVAPNNQLLDLWVSKSYEIGGQGGHVRFGNQVLNWGESYFAVGGLNATNALDIQKLLTPGVQIKEVVLPAPMISIGQGLGHGFHLEGYYQFGWNGDRFPAVGTYWSTWNQLGKGAKPVYVNSANFNLNSYPGDPTAAVTPLGDERHPRSGGQYGLNLHYKPQSAAVDFGLYAMNYHDKAPVLGYDGGTGSYYFRYLDDRKVYGVSANFALGDWAVGTELAYRPRDAVTLTGCSDSGNLDFRNSGYAGSCQQWKDMRKSQFDVVGQLNMQPSDYPALKKIGADFAVLTIEGTFVAYPGVSRNGLVTSIQGGASVVQGYAAGYGAWLDNSKQIVASVGSPNSAGMTVDFNWTYDGTAISGWQVTPGVTFFAALRGNTPNFLAQYEKGFKSLNFYTLFNKNPAVWQAGVNYTHFFGGDPVTQPYGDRNNIGIFLTRNF